MAEELATVATPALPKTGQIGFKEAMGVQEPFVKRKAELQQGITAAEGDIAKATQAQSEVLQSGKMQAQKDFGTAQEGAMQGLQQKMEAEPLPAFIPTKDTAQDLAGLFSIVSVIGMIAGKSNGQQAMNAMNGMLEGYQKGRGDLYKKEAAEFDKNFKAMLSKHAEFRKEMEDAVKLAATNKEAGMQAAELAATKAGSSIVQAQLRKGDLLGAYKLVDESGKGADKALTLESNVRQKAADRAASDARAKRQIDAANERSRLDREAKAEAAKTKTSGTRGGAAQETALRVMQQDIGNAQYNLTDLKNLAEPTGKLPGGSVAFAQKFTGDVSSMILRYAANQSIDEGLQGMDALMLNTAFDIASAQSGGRGQLSDAKVRAIVSQMPLDEQPESTKATKWAALFTRVDEANKSMPEDKRVEIPQELRNYYMRGRIGGGAEKIATPEDIETTAKANNLTYEQTVEKLKAKGFRIKTLDSAEGDY
jgi:hypothetical protein